MSKNWTIRKYEDGDEERIVKYQNMEMSKKNQKSVKNWKWEYASNPANFKAIWIAEDGATLAGHYALLPLKMKVGSVTLVGAQSVDTFTHNEYRRLGIFVTLASKVYETAADKDVSILYGFPSEGSFHGFVKKLNWIRVTSIDKMHKPLNLYSFLISVISSFMRNGPRSALSSVFHLFLFWFQRRNVLRGFSRIQTRRIMRFGQTADDLWSQIAEYNEIRVVKDSEYLNWRYIKKPDNTYAIHEVEVDGRTKGFIIFDRKLMQTRLLKMCLVLDIITKTKEEDIRLMLLIASELAKRRGADSIALWASKDSFISELIRQDGYLKTGELILIARQNRRVFNSKILRDVKRWFIMAGDTDIA